MGSKSKQKAGKTPYVATIEEVAETLGISRSTAYAKARANELPVSVIRVGKRLMVSRAALAELLGVQFVPADAGVSA